MAPITAASGDKAAAPINADADQVKPGPKAVAAPPAPTAATLGKAAEHSTPSQRPDDAGLTGTANAPAMQTSSLQPARQPNQPPARRPSYENVTARRDGSGHQAATPQTVSPALLRRAHRAHDGAATSQRTTHQLPVRFTPPPRNRRYGLGFALGLAVMAAIAGLYLAAPKLAKGGWADAALTQFHSDADRGRFWLDQQVGQLLNRD